MLLSRRVESSADISTSFFKKRKFAYSFILAPIIRGICMIILIGGQILTINQEREIAVKLKSCPRPPRDDSW